MTITDAEIERLDLELWPGLDVEASKLKDKPPLYHYTTARGLRGIVEQRAMWATDHRFMNDTQEVELGERVVRSVFEALAAEPSRTRVERNVLSIVLDRYDNVRVSRMVVIFIASFSEKPDLLSQWRAYAPNGGYSIGFNFDLKTMGLDRDLRMSLIQCEYDEAALRARVRERFQGLLERLNREVSRYRDPESEGEIAGVFIALLRRHAALFSLELKHPAFFEEREWRLVGLILRANLKDSVRFRDGAVGIIPYMGIPLTKGPLLNLAKVYVGPAVEQRRAVDAATMLLDHYGYAGADLVVPSGIPYRGW